MPENTQAIAIRLERITTQLESLLPAVARLMEGHQSHAERLIALETALKTTQEEGDRRSKTTAIWLTVASIGISTVITLIGKWTK